MLLALQNPLGFRSPLSCWDRDFGWSWLERVTKDFVHLEKRGGSDVCLQPSTQPVATTGRGHGPAQGDSIFSTQTQKTPPSPQESDAALHPPLTRGDSGVPTLKSHYQQHYHTTVGCSQRFRASSGQLELPSCVLCSQSIQCLAAQAAWKATSAQLQPVLAQISEPCSQTQRQDPQSRASTGSCRYFVSFKQRGWNSAATSLGYSWMPITD